MHTNHAQHASNLEVVSEVLQVRVNGTTSSLRYTDTALIRHLAQGSGDDRPPALADHSQPHNQQSQEEGRRRSQAGRG